MIYAAKKRKHKPRAYSYLLNDKELNWLRREFPHYNNPTISKMFVAVHGWILTAEQIKGFAKRYGWHKHKEEISEERRKNAKRTNNKRWGTPLDEDEKTGNDKERGKDHDADND